jgi:putative transferase (TIGR04331 family)
MQCLVTTALEDTWGDSECLIFLGEWCKRFERSSIWTDRVHTLAKYHWDDRAKLRRDQDYLRNLHDEYLGDLAGALGRIHKLDRSARYWQILLDPWLSRYLSVVFDRWESLRIAFDGHGISHTIILDSEPLPPARDQLEFFRLAVGDEWNHELFSDILTREYSTKCLIQRRALPTHLKSATPAARMARFLRSWKWEIASRIDRVMGRLARDNHVAFIHSYFPLEAFLRLNLRLRQLPTFFLRDFESSALVSRHDDPALHGLRDRFELLRPSTDGFQSFLRRRLVKDMPQVFLELFANMGRQAATVKARPKIILTANDHVDNDLFKRWVAEKVHEGIPFVVMEHGSGIPPLFSAMRFEEEIADFKTTWAVPYGAKQIQLPANKLAGRRRRAATGTRLLVVGQEMPRYAFDAQSMPISGQTLTGFDLICRLHDGLVSEPQSAFLVKPYPNLGWCTRDRFIDRLGRSKVSADPRLDYLMRRARIVVCTYPQTTFSEAMTCGAPAILVYIKELWETMPQFDGLLDALSAVQIVFSDPLAAADHINDIWSNPMSWWQSPKVRLVRERYEREALDIRTNWIEPWVQFATSLMRQNSAGQLANARDA